MKNTGLIVTIGILTVLMTISPLITPFGRLFWLAVMFLVIGIFSFVFDPPKSTTVCGILGVIYGLVYWPWTLNVLVVSILCSVGISFIVTLFRGGSTGSSSDGIDLDFGSGGDGGDD